MVSSQRSPPRGDACVELVTESVSERSPKLNVNRGTTAHWSATNQAASFWSMANAVAGVKLIRSTGAPEESSISTGRKFCRPAWEVCAKLGPNLNCVVKGGEQQNASSTKNTFSTAQAGATRRKSRVAWRGERRVADLINTCMDRCHGASCRLRECTCTSKGEKLRRREVLPLLSTRSTDAAGFSRTRTTAGCESQMTRA